MKEVIAIIRPNRARLTKQKLAEKGFVAYTEARISGRGKQKGLQYGQAGSSSGGWEGISFLPKRMLTVFVNDEEVEQLIGALIENNKTGEIGDGKIFICPLEGVTRIRTDEMNRVALV